MDTLNQYGDMNPIQQQYEDTCAVKSQQIILNDFGIDVTEDQLVQHSIDCGWYDGNGTKMGDVGRLLADAGIPVTQMQDANVYTLMNELAQGHKVIVSVDADELWDKNIMTPFNDMLHGETPNHALIVAGIDTTDPGHAKVILTDPGTGDYCKEYPLEQFQDAWNDSKCFMVSTQIPAPLEYNPEMINFDYAAGHLSAIGAMPYDQFVTNYIDVGYQPLATSFDTFGTDFGFQNSGFESGWLLSDDTISVAVSSDMDDFAINNPVIDDHWGEDLTDGHVDIDPDVDISYLS